MKFGLKENTISSINSVFLNYPEIDMVLLYGSRAKGTYRDASDIDLTVLGENLSIGILSKIENELDELLLPYKIDLSLYAHIDHVDLLNHIERVGVPFYQKA